MHYLHGIRLLNGNLMWQERIATWEEEGFTVTISKFGKDERGALKAAKKTIGENSVSWIRPRNAHWQIDVTELRRWLVDNGNDGLAVGLDFLQGVVDVVPRLKIELVLCHAQKLGLAGMV